MSKKNTSETHQYETESLGGGRNWVTKISDGRDSAKGEGTTAEKSQKAASEKWDKKK
jgi:hypothetical protein